MSSQRQLIINDDNLTPKQCEAMTILAGPARHILLRGGARSGKTWLLMRAICIRALKAPGSTHLVLRYRFNHLKTSIIHGTMPDVLAKCFPGLEVRLDKTDWFHEFPNGSRIWYGGLDDKGRTEKILGQEHSTILFEEISHGISWDARNLAVTRLSQNSGLKLKTYATCNPPSQAHWSYKLWKLAQNPKTGEPLPDPENYASLHMNPTDNLANLPEEYIQELSNTSGKDRIRFFEGEWQPAVENALWTIDSFKTMTPPSPGDDFDTFRTTLSRIVVAVDPSGGSGKDGEKSDETGIIVAGRMHSGRIVILEDATVRAGPAGWARKVVEMYDKWEADRIVAEKNYGGAMVEHTIKAVRRGLPVKMVNATRGKHVRAGPVAALYATEPGVYHLGHMPELEDQMMNFTDDGYEGDNSPDRCLAAGTMVETETGPVPIEEIAVGDRVWTRAGLRPVTACGMTRESAQVVTILFSNGQSIIGTGNHPVFVEGSGFTRLDALVWGDTVLPLQRSPQWLTEKARSSTEENTSDTPTALANRLAATSISGPASGQTPQPFTGMSGRPTMAPSRMGGTSTTLMATLETTRSRILKPSRLLNTLLSTKRNIARNSRRLVQNPWTARSEPLLRGTALKRVFGSMPGLAENLGKIVKKINMTAYSVVLNSNPSPRKGRACFALANVSTDTTIRPRSTTKTESASSVAGSSTSKRARSKKSAPVYVLGLYENQKKQPVFNLTVDGENEYYANGILVHNCDAMVWAVTELGLGSKAAFSGRKSGVQAVRGLF